MYNSNIITLTIADLYKGIDNKYHYFYKIVNNINNKYYYGVHSTFNINDRYVGSGSRLKTAYDKYGIENFTMYILKCFDNRQDMFKYESEVVDQKIIKDSECYNILHGGIDAYEKIKHMVTTKGLIHMHKDNINILVSREDVDNKLKDGFELGQSVKSNLNKIVISRGSEERFILKSQLNYYLSLGWKKGGKTRNKGQISFAKGLMWINNGTSCKRIHESELPQYISEGWAKGTVQATTKGSIRITNGKQDKLISKSELPQYISEGWVKGTYINRSNRVWINKEDKHKLISKSELPQYISEGWVKGRIIKSNPKIKGRITVIKDDKMKYIYPQELPQYISEGWVKGSKNKGNRACSGRITISKKGIIRRILPEQLNNFLSEGWVRGRKS